MRQQHQLPQRVQESVGSELSGDEDSSFAAEPPVAQKTNNVPADSDRDENNQNNTPASLFSAKLKRDRDDFESDDEPAPSSPAKKKKYKSKKDRKPTKPAECEDGGAGDNFDPAIGEMNQFLVADHFARTVKRCYKNETAIELEERYPPSAMFTDTSNFTADRKKDMLRTYLEFVVAGDRSKLTTTAQEKASPHTIVVCTSGIRGADLARELRTYETEGNKVSKLFAKHFKIEQQAVFLRKTRVGFGVGTPDRIVKLIETKALKIDSLARIVVDGSFLDEKNRGFWNMAEVFKPMLSLLKMKEVQEKIEAEELRVMVF